MSGRVYRVVSISVEPSVDSTEMRRVHYAAVDGEVFGGTRPDGHLSELVTPQEAKRFQPGELVTLIVRERES